VQEIPILLGCGILWPCALWVVDDVRSLAVRSGKKPKHATTEGYSYQPGSESTRQAPLSRPPSAHTGEKAERRRRARQIAGTLL